MKIDRYPNSRLFNPWALGMMAEWPNGPMATDGQRWTFAVNVTLEGLPCTDLGGVGASVRVVVDLGTAKFNRDLEGYDLEVCSSMVGLSPELSAALAGLTPAQRACAHGYIVHEAARAAGTWLFGAMRATSP